MLSNPPPVFLRTVLLAAAASCLLASSCRSNNGGPAPSKNDTTDSETGFSRATLLNAFGQCALKQARDFLIQATALDAATQALAQASSPATSEIDTARGSFRTAMASWQVSELFQFGPAAAKKSAGGQELRFHIYSWPSGTRCPVEEMLVSQGYQSQTFSETFVNRRGLGALEYLLFYEGEDTACPSSSAIVAQGQWAALTREERTSRKRAYAAAVAHDLQQRASRLVDAWDPSKDNFLQTLSTAGSGNTTYPSTQAALNAISDAAFYLEGDLKDIKLAIPLGLRDCATANCAQQVESPFAHLAKANLRSNLRGFRQLMQGCEDGYSGYGFDDLIDSVPNAGGLTDKMATQLNVADAALQAIEEEDLAAAVSQDRASVRAVYDAIKSVTDLLKTEVSSVLDLELPQSLEGDND